MRCRAAARLSKQGGGVPRHKSESCGIQYVLLAIALLMCCPELANAQDESETCPPGSVLTGGHIVHGPGGQLIVTGGHCKKIPVNPSPPVSAPTSAAPVSSTTVAAPRRRLFTRQAAVNQTRMAGARRVVHQLAGSSYISQEGR